ncbi:PTS system glucitol/sorbitol-specific transporter subunit IIA [Phocoenobacter uteri]|uniref:PTS system glucitol/sorbitol-specific transporter subunit IIA n=1 Tax=Phocoenobacter uteri TaxID=146806 RepID=A0A379CCH9_9PAST|nr:PTS glucitol/sorbitol transporter subunit IIA [Phocoenobacter uteri]MDG6881831.1 PTS glucitol/sorbitol transporter subunit IIA [Phocoenobacter uteri]SUB59868.1 PTS system glucitol/sorbitol-specific transporter subunit IIA [Phocoenobacter uteri]
MKVIYQVAVTKVGKFAKEALSENMFITFKQNVPKDLEDYCFIHNHDELRCDVKAGDILQIDDKDYPITAVGNVASCNLKELGHISFRFDNATQAEYPGNIHVRGDVPELDIHSVIAIKQQ